MATFNAPETTTAVPASPASYNGQSFRTEPLSACVKTITSGDRDRIITALVMAFSADPMSRWMYPNPHQYLTYFPRFVEIFGGKAFEFNTVYSNRAHSGAALWFPPGVEPDNEPVADLLRQSISETDQAQVFAVFEEMERYHPTFPHWYLPILGVDPTQQGKGYGSALLQPILNQPIFHSMSVMGLRFLARFSLGTHRKFLP